MKPVIANVGWGGGTWAKASSGTSRQRSAARASAWRGAFLILLEREPHAPRGDRHGLHADVLAHREPGAGIVRAADVPVRQGVIGLQVAKGPVEDEARGEAVGESDVPLGSQE